MMGVIAGFFSSIFKIVGAVVSLIGMIIGGSIGYKIFRSFGWVGQTGAIMGKMLSFILVGVVIGAMPGAMIGGILDKDDNTVTETTDNTDEWSEGTGTATENTPYDDMSDDSYNADIAYGNTLESTANTKSQNDTFYDASSDNTMVMEYSTEDTDNENDSYTEYTVDTASDDSEMEADASDNYTTLMMMDWKSYNITENDLRGLTSEELTYLRNSIYAKYGYVFQASELNNYFSQFDWYSPDSSVTGEELTSGEKKNVAFIKQYQEDNNLLYTPR